MSQEGGKWHDYFWGFPCGLILLCIDYFVSESWCPWDRWKLLAKLLVWWFVGSIIVWWPKDSSEKREASARWVLRRLSGRE